MKMGTIFALLMMVVLIAFSSLALANATTDNDALVTINETLVLNLGMSKAEFETALKNSEAVSDVKSTNSKDYRLDYYIDGELFFTGVTFNDELEIVAIQGGVTGRGLSAGDSIKRMYELYGSEAEHETFFDNGRYDTYTFKLDTAVLVVTTYGFNEDYLKHQPDEKEPIVNHMTLHAQTYAYQY